MTETLIDKIVEAGAMAVAEGPSYLPWDALDDRVRNKHRRRSRDCLSAAFAAAEARGVVLCRVPGEAVNQRGSMVEEIRVIGHNACRAATLAGKVTL
jgi:hypothetical protein